MKTLTTALRLVLALQLAALTILASVATADEKDTGKEHRRLYVATPGIRNYLEYGGHGLLVFDIDDGHKFVKRIKTGGLDPDGKAQNVKGICASAATNRLYISTIKTLTCLDLTTEAILWERPYEGGCDRMAIAPDGKTIYLPSLEGPHWNVVAAMSGDVIARIVPNSGSHNTVFGLDGTHVYLAGLRSPLLTVADAATNKVERTVGPFAASIRPFTVNGRQTLCFVNVNGLLGFEIGDLTTGKKLHRVEVQGFEVGPTKRHGCPSHGVALSPDEEEVWVVDAHNRRVHVFDATQLPPRPLASVELRDEPGWVTFSIDGKYAYPSTGDVIEAKTRRIVARLADEHGAAVQSEKMVEVDLSDGRAARVGDQFGVGRVAR
ncbi:MAG TPA: hypothetical protein VG406_26965 [Isosphaeraceae bacterium]|jgi:DNA-binding beta-propeller fold protein YncE|nr:hypothetical protein [Isosphaeraceae bacterium]